MARRWRKRIVKSRIDAEEVEHYIEVRYEDLVTDTEGVLRRVCELIELDFDPVMLSYHERADERLQEMARRAAREEGPSRARGRRAARSARDDDQAAEGRPRRGLEARDDARPRTPSSRWPPATCSTTSATRPRRRSPTGCLPEEWARSKSRTERGTDNAGTTKFADVIKRD